MSKQPSLAIFFKKPNLSSLLSNSYSAISNDFDLDVTENESKPPLKKVKLTTKNIKV